MSARTEHDVVNGRPTTGPDEAVLAAARRHAATAEATERARSRASSGMPPTALDEVLPDYDFGSHHEVAIGEPIARVIEAIESYRPSSDSSWLTRLLFRLRGFTPGEGEASFRKALEGEGFRALAERPGQEIVFGVAGRFWAIYEPGALDTVADLEAFRAYAEPGSAKAVLGLRVESLGPRQTLLRTETRVACVDAAAYRRFALYWGLIKPASGWIRREMLRGIAHRASHL